ncbi:molybdopterin-guanine dinucleotide biosynthesis protein MobA [Flavobacterium rivuli WB 3.3-2 = DSM 21788]|uniref:Molybdopterin-guanine dinucleotide biosynthesis protein MobA n=1 Tax=Flavobacterium rivuli WB 3.3-2 = DSM 21788 TaxID=1121895 RepID=A0A0A2M1N4_9FLAO|nr:nucleotidyltransferase family protein [Flavobacterium rivuli]KGO85526.1 molybdopterin-guanine dinucleotide biosynthesis protein MobA [Flavobacterium rivuli WB 3.3-2 = DSM 21788]
MEQTGIIILAAGNSSRLGRPKQLLEYKGYTLLRNTIIQAKLLPDSVVIVVTGAYKKNIDEELAYTAVKVVYNPEWETGMASSLAIGLQQLRLLNPQVKACIFTVCDQPFLTAQVFKDLIDSYNKTGKGIIASAYANALGTPVLFSNNYFKELENLKGHEGAKKIIYQYENDVASVVFEKGATDIDTIEDYNNLISQ